MDLLDLDMFGQLDDSCELRRLMPGAPAEDQDDVATTFAGFTQCAQVTKIGP